MVDRAANGVSTEPGRWQTAPEEAIFGAVAEEVGRVLGAEATAVLRFLGDERAVIVGVWREGGTRGMPVNAELDFDRRNSAVGQVRSTRAPARADSYAGRSGELPAVMEAIGLRSSVAAPVIVRAKVWGAVVASTRREQPLPAGSEHRLAYFGELVAHAVAAGEARRRLEASRLRLVEAADESRQQLERALHEGAQQHLLALMLRLRAASASADPGSALEGRLDDALAEAMQLQAALRKLARELYPVILSERGVGPAVQALAVRSAVPVHLRGLPSRRFPRVLEATAYLVVEAALASAAEHADVTQVSLLVDDRGDRLVVEVSHDSGGEPSPVPALAVLAERAAAVGGRLEVEPAQPAGTVVRAEFLLAG
jgi:signal transduction histidine kinase